MNHGLPVLVFAQNSVDIDRLYFHQRRALIARGKRRIGANLNAPTARLVKTNITLHAATLPRRAASDAYSLKVLSGSKLESRSTPKPNGGKRNPSSSESDT